MRLWFFQHRSINRNLYRFLSAQQEAERRGEETFPCPVCGGRCRWSRQPGTGRLVCDCPDCGMYLRG